jgi:uncharacterized protein
MGSRILRLAVPFYAAFVLLAVTISTLTDTPLRLGANSVPVALGVGLVTAAGTVLSGVVAYRVLPVVREISEELAPVLLSGSSTWGLISVSVLSAVGEELLFRGVLQPLVGVVFSSVLFGLLHVGPDRRYLLWTVWAVAVGFLFAGLYVWTGGLLAPVVAHAAHNAATLVLWRRRWIQGKAGETV